MSRKRQNRNRRLYGLPRDPLRGRGAQSGPRLLPYGVESRVGVMEDKTYYDEIVANDWRDYRNGKRLFTYNKKEQKDLLDWFRRHLASKGTTGRWVLPSGIFYTIDRKAKVITKHEMTLNQKAVLFTVALLIDETYLDIYRPEIHIMNLYFFHQLEYKVKYSNEPIDDKLINELVAKKLSTQGPWKNEGYLEPHSARKSIQDGVILTDSLDTIFNENWPELRGSLLDSPEVTTKIVDGEETFFHKKHLKD